MVSVYQTFRAYILDEQKFCGLCLKTEKETRLVKPVNFLKFAKFLGAKIAHQSVCHLCEASCRVAVQVCDAIETGVELSIILKEMLRNKKKIQPWPLHIYEKIAVYNKKISDYRELRSYKFTETLCVDSTMEEHIKLRSKKAKKVPQVDSDDGSILPKWHPDLIPEIIELEDGENLHLENQNVQRPSVITSKPKPKLKKQETKITNTEVQEKPLTIIYPKEGNPDLPKLVNMDTFIATCNVSVATIWPGNAKLLVRIPTDNQNCIVHNIVNLNNRQFVPTLSCEIEGDELKYCYDDNYFPTVLRVGSDSDSLPATSVSEPKENSSSEVNSILEKALSIMDKKRNKQNTNTNKRSCSRIIQNADEDHPIAIITSVKSETEIVISDDEQGNSYTEKVNSYSEENNSYFEKMNSYSEQNNSYGEKAKNYSEQTNSYGEKLNSATMNTITPIPTSLLKAKIDWEDKIPMDVITLLDPKLDSKMLCSTSTIK